MAPFAGDLALLGNCPFKPNLYTVCQSRFIAMLELARDVRIVFTIIVCTCLGFFVEYCMIREVYFACNIVSFCFLR